MVRITKKSLAATLCLVGAAFTAQPALSAAARLPFSSSFETGSFSEWNGGLDASMTVTSSVASAGRYSTQAVMTPGRSTDNYKEYVFGDNRRVGGEAADDGVWLSFDSRFDTGFRFGDGAVVHKIAIINLEDVNDGRRRYQIILNVWTSDNTYFIEHLKWNADGSFNRAMPTVSQNIGTKAAVRFGQWDKLKLYIKPNTLGQSNGIVRLWVNGELKAEHTNVALRENVPVNPNKLIMSNYVTQTTTSGTQRWDNWHLSETDPDGAVRPNPPVLDSVQ
nr:heparin lyase I family protein [uncultured Steroidobacter sp.]